jgi:N utilization substance protein B
MPHSRPSRNESSSPQSETNKQEIRTPVVKGTRRIAREKAMQLLSAQEISGVHWRENFPFVFPYEFRVHEAEAPKRLLSEEEVEKLEADFLIDWDDDIKQFTLELLDKADFYDKFTTEIIEKFSQNWDLGRLARIDRVVIKIAITEFIGFAEIPTKVSINEAIEIVKKYSTEKSGTFVNGILDSALVELTEQGKIKKTGRGLLDVTLGKNH